jgi:hypothetical protein
MGPVPKLLLAEFLSRNEDATEFLQDWIPSDCSGAARSLQKLEKVPSQQIDMTVPRLCIGVGDSGRATPDRRQVRGELHRCFDRVLETSASRVCNIQTQNNSWPLKNSAT